MLVSGKVARSMTFTGTGDLSWPREPEKQHGRWKRTEHQHRWRRRTLMSNSLIYPHWSHNLISTQNFLSVFALLLQISNQNVSTQQYTRWHTTCKKNSQEFKKLSKSKIRYYCSHCPPDCSIQLSVYYSYVGTQEVEGLAGGGASRAPISPWAVLKRLMGLDPSVIRVDLSPRLFSSFTCERTATLSENSFPKILRKVYIM